MKNLSLTVPSFVTVAFLFGFISLTVSSNASAAAETTCKVTTTINADGAIVRHSVCVTVRR